MVTLARAEYWDKVYGCWMGKNCGGTLGAPLERAYGEEEPFTIEWYPELREGGIPNDDLELQLIWLKAVEERGFDLTARDLAGYWLDHVGYNWDEYGLHKTNLRLGLLPPVSGFYNNWFKDCMGSPIRSEIWACLAPGMPALAAHYAYEDAIVDHAGGESVWGEIFNATLQSAAFVEQDPDRLLDIALSFIPADSVTARAVQAARTAHRQGLDWKEARRRVMIAAPHYVAQYSPVNMGFQVLGWLYGADFGDALCITVNCGYDTDCTGATVGALLGILAGRHGLPERWTAPLGEAIATNESWGGLQHVSSGPNPVPTTLDELTDRVCMLGERLLVLRGAPLRIGDRTDLEGLAQQDLRAPAGGSLAHPNPLSLHYRQDAFEVTLDYIGSPTVAPDGPAHIQVHLRNPHPDPLHAATTLHVPAGWVVTPAGAQSLAVAAGEEQLLDFSVAVGEATSLQNANRALLEIVPEARPADPAIPVVFAGARRWQIWGPRPLDGAVPLAALDAAPDQAPGGSAGAWRIRSAPDNALPVPEDWTGVLDARLHLHSPRRQDVRIGIPGTSPRQLWLNGTAVHAVRETSLLRPNYGGDHHSYVDATLEEGWNTVLIRYVRDAGMPPFAAHFTLATTGLYHGIHDVGWTSGPADASAGTW